ncbi:MAG: glycosyltransferase N-terminal domain-containing protein [Bacteroidota bacterium]
MWAYTFGVWLYGMFLKIASGFHPKAKAWVNGRKNLLPRLQESLEDISGPRIWMHCASLGEFEQGRPVLEALAETYPDHSIILTFFSPSGYEIRKNYKGAALVMYLPLDLPGLMRRFLDILDPDLAFFVKYDLWLNTLKILHSRQIPTLLISARPRPDSAWFRWPLRSWYHDALANLSHIFVQDQAALDLLKVKVPSAKASLSGDTRYDRVVQTRAGFSPIPEIEDFVQGRPCLVAGSIWPADEAVLMPVLLDQLQAHPDRCAILAPHEIHADQLDVWCARHPDLMIRHSQLGARKSTHRVLWIDNIGMLSRLYAYADMAYLGGAFGRGLHNILEAAVFGVPVVFGPKIEKFPEASALIAAGAGFSVQDKAELDSLLKGWQQDPALLQEAGKSATNFVQEQAGATSRIMQFITEAEILRLV